MSVKTAGLLPDRGAEKVKTEKLPFARLVRGKYWYFKRGDLLCPIAGEYGDDAFIWHYNELCRISGVPGIGIDDPRDVYFMGWAGGQSKSDWP